MIDFSTPKSVSRSFQLLTHQSCPLFEDPIGVSHVADTAGRPCVAGLLGPPVVDDPSHRLPRRGVDQLEPEAHPDGVGGELRLPP